MDAHGVHVLDETDRDHGVVSVANHLKLKFLPAQHGLLHQHLMDKTCLKPPGADGPQFVPVIDQTAPRAPHGVSRAEHNGVPQLLRDGQGFLHTVGHLAARHVDAELFHGLLELDAVLTALDGVCLHADDLHAVLLQHSGLVQLRAEVQARLATQVGQQRVGAFPGDDLFKTFPVERLDVRDVRHLRVCHDGRGVGVHQHDLVAQGPECLARLGAGVVELAGLADDDGP